MEPRAGMRKTFTDCVKITDWRKDIPGHLAPNARTYLFPLIRGTSKSGKETEWLLSVRIYQNMGDLAADSPMVITPEIASNADKQTAHIARIQALYRLGTGVVQRKEPTIVSIGKNVGRANETNVFCQALRDALGRYNHQLRAGAEPQIADEEEFVCPRPMLACVYDDVYGPNDAPSPLYVQRKYNGVRAIGTLRPNTSASSEAILYSRKGLRYSGFADIKRDVARVCTAWCDGTFERIAKEDDIGTHVNGMLFLDGELYQHGVPLQIISGIVRRSVDDNSRDGTLHFMVYDIFVVNKGRNLSNELRFDERYAIMRMISRANLGLTRICFAETFMCVNSESETPAGNARAIEQARALYARFIAEKYEGAIVRTNSTYDHSHHDSHSKSLLKIKPTRDAEYEITGFTLGVRGKAHGALLFTCRTEKGIEFNVTPTGAIAERIALAQKFAQGNEFANNWLGKPLIVMFDELSATGVPQRARTDGVIRECA